MLAIDHRCTAFTRCPGRRPARPISSAGMAASMARTMSGWRYQHSAADTRMYGVTGMRADSRAVRSAVIARETSEWSVIRRLASARTSRTDNAFLSGAVDLDLGPGVGLAVGELHTHHARKVELAAHDPDVAAKRAAGAHDRGELVVQGCEEGGARVAHEGDDALGARVHQVEHVVGTGQQPPPPAHRRVVEHLGAPSHFFHRAGA